jgi:hypothetical protein
MMRRGKPFAVMGFTEAEFGFVLAATFAAFAYAIVVQARGSAERHLASIEAQMDSLRKRNAELEKRFAALRDSVNKTSNRTPYCDEKGEPPAPVAMLVAYGRDSVQTAQGILSVAQVLLQLDTVRQRGLRLGCRYTVALRPSARVGSPDYIRIRNRLRQRFNVIDPAR